MSKESYTPNFKSGDRVRIQGDPKELVEWAIDQFEGKSGVIQSHDGSDAPAVNLGGSASVFVPESCMVLEGIDWAVVGPKCAEALKKLTVMIEVREDPKHVVPFIPYAFYSDFLDELAKAQEALALAKGGEG